jgi:DNA-binding transcriptional regulator YhcF (GntR family)
MEFRKQQPIYKQIADYVLENILAGEWQVGDKIQSVRELAANIQVNPNTIMRSYTYLQDQNIIANKRGIGYFVSEGAVDKTKRLKKDEFLKQFLPEVFKTMDLLNISMDDLKKIYDEEKAASTT